MAIERREFYRACIDGLFNLCRIARERIPAALRVDVIHPTVPDDDAGEQLALDTSVDMTALYTDWLTRSGRVADPRLLRAFEAAREHAERTEQ